MIDRAIALAAQVHEGQTDKAGEPYILHALEVMRKSDKLLGSNTFAREEVLCAAVLHDVIEDFDGGEIARGRLSHRIKTEFGDTVFEALTALTHPKHEPYLDSYIERVAQNWIATIVKIADLTHNMDPSRLPTAQTSDESDDEAVIGEKEFKRWDKYRRALVRLREADQSTRSDLDTR